MTRDGGGWTVFQRRIDGSVDFYRNWAAYVAGFGDLEGNLWIGLDKLHAMTAAYSTELHIYMDTFEGETAWAQYESFYVGDSATGYGLSIGKYTGSTGDSLRTHNNMKFSTFDNDQDTDEKHCAEYYHSGGWWFEDCFWANLNGHYQGGPSGFGLGIHWREFKGIRYSLKTTIMKVRRLN